MGTVTPISHNPKFGVTDDGLTYAVCERCQFRTGDHIFTFDATREFIHHIPLVRRERRRPDQVATDAVVRALRRRDDGVWR
jgi:hypothetical protein